MPKIVKRVPYDFDAPIMQNWGEYFISTVSCKACDGRGATESRKALERILSLVVNTASQPEHRDHKVFQMLGIECDETIFEFIDAARGGKIENNPLLASVIYTVRATEKILDATGLPPTWGLCNACGGTGVENSDVEVKEPPKGDGWQLWLDEFTLIPITPVFRTPEGLAQWCSDHLDKRDYLEWLTIIGEDQMIEPSIDGN